MLSCLGWRLSSSGVSNMFDSWSDSPGVMRHRFTCQDLSGTSHRTEDVSF